MTWAQIPRDAALRFALRQVHGGTVVTHGSYAFSGNGRSLHPVLIPLLRALLDRGQVRLDEQTHAAGRRRVLIAAAGEAFLADLESARDPAGGVRWMVPTGSPISHAIPRAELRSGLPQVTTLRNCGTWPISHLVENPLAERCQLCQRAVAEFEGEER